MLREIDRDIWVAEQAQQYLGLSIGTKMTVVRLANQTLAVISPIQVTDALLSQLVDDPIFSYRALVCQFPKYAGKNT